VPPELTAVLAALAVQASPGDFAAAERLLGGSFSGPRAAVISART
jgi:hypothetical protein